MTATNDVDPCPECGEKDNIHLQDSTPTTDIWACKECGCSWVIEIEAPEEL